MAHARLHVICGNCGSNDDFTFKVSKEIDDSKEESVEITKVYIACENCSTLHDLADNAKLEEKKKC